MHKLISTFAAATVFAMSPVAHADTWRFDNLSLRSLSDADISLVAQSGSATTISFDSLALETGRYAAHDNAPRITDDVYYPGGIDHLNMSAIQGFRFDLAQGLTLTGVTLNATFSGELRTGQPGGSTQNDIAMQAGFGKLEGQGSWVDHSLTTERFVNLDGTVTTSTSIDLPLLGGGNIDAHDGLYFNVSALFGSYASAARRANGDLIEESYANVWAPQITMTFHTAAVPEPETYAMLGVGLALLGAAGWRKRSQQG